MTIFEELQESNTTHNLKAFFKYAGVTLVQVSKHTKIPYTSLSSYMNNHREMPFSVRVKLKTLACKMQNELQKSMPESVEKQLEEIVEEIKIAEEIKKETKGS